MQGISGTKMKPGMMEGNGPTQAPDAGINTPGGVGGELNRQKDSKTAQTDAQFGDVWKQIQSRYGAKAEKPREIKKTLGKDDFLRIMITQMKNQDPSKPFDAEQMASQMAQYASVEQLQNLNSNVSKMVNNGQPLERLAMTNLIGKTVTIDKERFVHSDNEASSLGYNLARDAKNVKLKIIAEQGGEAVLEKDLGPLKAGDQTFVWDGAKSNGLAAKPGNYIYKIEAVDVSDRTIAMDSKGQAKVVGVAFDGPEGTLLVGDANNPQKITMRNVIRIDTSDGSGAQAGIPGARSMASTLQAQGMGQAMQPGMAAPQGTAIQAAGQQGGGPAQPKSGLAGNWVSFEKGVGSKNLDASSMSPEARRALEAYESARADTAKSADGQIAAAENNENQAEKGFPSGFSSGEN
jgi:flagellar basal-body rod modification protein FlgD